MINFVIKIVFFMFLSFFSKEANAQFSKTASCQQSDFDKKVNSYLNYTAPVIGVDQAYKEKEEILFLDAREKEEYHISHLPGAKYLGYDNFNPNILEKVNKNSKIVVYCSIGYRSEKIATKLRNLGFTNVFNLYGSIFEWSNKSYPVYQNKKQVFEVHTYNKKWSQWVTNPRIKKVW